MNELSPNSALRRKEGEEGGKDREDKDEDNDKQEEEEAVLASFTEHLSEMGVGG